MANIQLYAVRCCICIQTQHTEVGKLRALTEGIWPHEVRWHRPRSWFASKARSARLVFTALDGRVTYNPCRRPARDRCAHADRSYACARHPKGASDANLGIKQADPPANEEYIPWTIANKYYTADVRFRVVSLAQWTPAVLSGVPAAIFAFQRGEVRLTRLLRFRLRNRSASFHSHAYAFGSRTPNMSITSRLMSRPLRQMSFSLSVSAPSRLTRMTRQRVRTRSSRMLVSSMLKRRPPPPPPHPLPLMKTASQRLAISPASLTHSALSCGPACSERRAQASRQRLGSRSRCSAMAIWNGSMLTSLVLI